MFVLRCITLATQFLCIHFVHEKVFHGNVFHRLPSVDKEAATEAEAVQAHERLNHKMKDSEQGRRCIYMQWIMCNIRNLVNSNLKRPA